MDEHELFHAHGTRQVPLNATEDLLMSMRWCACLGNGDDDMCDGACIEGRPVVARVRRMETA